ncbi:MAG: hypothetical protein QM642_06215 [Edaphocola sp.]
MKHYLLGISLSLLCISCGKNNTTQPEEDSPATAGIFPVPPAEWMQGITDPYYAGGYVGDPMPFYENGTFHVFFLHDARDGATGFHPWDKFTTSDLLSYAYAGRMIPYGTSSDQDVALGTGSVIKVGNVYYGYYTGHNGGFPAIGKPQEAIMYATSTDLQHWTKKEGFYLYAPTGYSANDFRDPQVMYNEEEQKYYMLVSAQKDGQPVVATFTSQDPSTDEWTLEDPFFVSDNDDYWMLECPDVFKMGSKWYLTFSEDYVSHTTHYRVADDFHGPYQLPASGNEVLNGSYAYAGKTASDGTHRYMFAWTGTKSGSSDAGTKEWAGNLVTTQLVQNSDGSLGVHIPDQFAQLIKNDKELAASLTTGTVSVASNNYTLNATSDTAMAVFGNVQGSVLLSASVTLQSTGGVSGFVLNAKGTTPYYLVFDPANNEIRAQQGLEATSVVDARVPFTFGENAAFDVQLVIDGTVVAAYVDNTVALMARVYSVTNKPWGLFAAGSKVQYGSLNYKVN